MGRIIGFESYISSQEDHITSDSILSALRPTDCCFYCNEPLDDDLVFWANDIQIWLHPHCAITLGNHLIKDGIVQTRNDGTILGIFRGTR